jgi:photosystem II stability/assembly factor-like uncharacterized protein
MKIIIYFFLTLILLTSGKVFSQGWMQQSSGLSTRLTEVSFVNTQTGYVSGFGGKILKTTNGGATWVQQVTNTTTDLYCIASYQGSWKSPDTLYACGSGGTVLRTFNGGQNWASLSSGTSSTLKSIVSIQALGGGISVIACGDNGTIRVSTNGGGAWTAGSNTGTENLNSVFFINPLTGWVTGNNGKLAYSVFLGSFGTQPAPSPDDLLDFTTFSNSYILYISTSTGKVARSTNGGGNWIIHNTGVSTRLNSIEQSGNNLWVAGDNGVIKYSSNSGANWVSQGPSSGINYYSVGMIDSLRGFIVGDNGTILSTVSGGTVNIQQLSSEVPENFNLSQNYPNPFNPSTNLEFRIAHSGFVTLKVYDMQGREIRTLVSKDLHPGVYKTKFDAGNLPGGAYFYRLTTGDFSETKKMLLLK